MERERIDSSVRTGIDTRSPKGRPDEQSDPACLVVLNAAQAPGIEAFARDEIARTRIW